MAEQDIAPGRRVSRELTEIRSVHGRAKTALAKIARDARFRADGHPAYTEPADPMASVITSVLQAVVELTAPFQREGKR